MLTDILVEALVTAKSILSVMRFSFQLPIEQSRRFHIDYPEILLISVILVAVKLCFPLGRHAPLLQVAGTEPAIRFDWTKWQKGIHELIDPSKASEKEPSFDKITVDQVTSMTAEELDQYFAHIASTIDRKSGLFEHVKKHTLTTCRRLGNHEILSLRKCSASRNPFSREHREG
jgi:hypothetical protein